MSFPILYLKKYCISIILSRFSIDFKKEIKNQKILLAIFFRIVYTRKNLKLKGGSRNETNTNNN